MECDLGRIRVHYNECGSGAPLVLIHGWTVDHRFEAGDYEPILSSRRGWRQIYLDLPGHGRTPAASWITSMDDMLEVVLGFIDAVLPDQRFVISGTSAGAYLAQGVVAQRAGDVDGLLLRVPLVEPDDAARRERHCLRAYRSGHIRVRLPGADGGRLLKTLRRTL